MASRANYPDKYRGAKIEWQDNKPFCKKGDIKIIKTNEGYKSIVLDNMTKEPMQARWIRHGCWSCVRPGTVIKTIKYVYRWNNGLFTEGVEIDAVKELNRLLESYKRVEEAVNLNSKKASLYDQLKASINGELLDEY